MAEVILVSVPIVAVLLLLIPRDPRWQGRRQAARGRARGGPRDDLGGRADLRAQQWATARFRPVVIGKGARRTRGHAG